MISPDDFVTEKHFLTIALGLYVSYLIVSVIASFLPESFLWGIHHLAFFDISTRSVLVALAIIVAFPPVSKTIVVFIEKAWARLRPIRILMPFLILFVGIGGTLVFYRFRIITDMYGDSRTLLSSLTGRLYGVADIFRLDESEPLSRLLHQVISQYFRIDLKTTFQLVSSICGGLFLISVCLFVKNIHASIPIKFLVTLFLVTCGTNQIFFGHVEDYTVVYLAIILFLMLGWNCFEGKRTFGLMAIILLIGIRLHMEMILFLPAFLYLAAYNLGEKFPVMKPWIEPKRIILLISLSVICAVIAYFFIFHAYQLSTDLQSERASKIFLPLENPLPYPHSYSLLSLNHLSDVLQEFLLTVTPGALIILCLGALLFKYIPWQNPRIVFFALGSFYFFLFDLTVNPLLTMPRDWDFLSLAAAPVTFLAIAVAAEFFQKVGSTAVSKAFLGIVLGGAIISSSIFAINSTELKAGQRLRSMGVWTYRSYFWGSAYMINVGLKMIPDINDEIPERLRILRNLSPYAASDLEISFLYQKLGQTYALKRDYRRASDCFITAIRTCKENGEAFKFLALVRLKSRQFDDALDVVDHYNELVNDPEVTEPKGLVVAEYIHYLRRLYTLFN
jgi:tetratricopeptide (TPR) repeat protein